MGRRKRVKTSTKMNKNGNGNGEAPISSTKTTRGPPLTTDNKIGGEISSKKMKRGESSKSCVETEADQSQESSVKETTMKNLPPENANANGVSSSSYWTRSRKEAPYPEIKELELTSKRKKDKDDSSNPPGQDQAVEAITEGPINDLPPEMLTKILKFVDPSTLFDCRLVSRKWNEISSGILTTKTDIMLKFKDYEIHWGRINFGPRERQKYKNNRLAEFVNSMKQSKHCPYASFFFQVDEPSSFDENDWIEFLSLFAPPNPNPKQKQKQNPIQNQRHKIKCLYLKCDSGDEAERLLLFMEKLRDILVNKIPRLEELGLEFASDIDDSKSIKWFPRSKTPEPESEPTTTLSSSIPVPIQLPYLKVLEIEPEMFLNLPGIVEDLLNAAVNLTEIQLEWPYWFGGGVTSQVLQFIHSIGKLHLLKQMEIDVDAEFLSSLKNSTKYSDFPLAFKLYKLKVYSFGSDVNPTFYSDASNFLSNLLKSSKDTLEKLKMPSLGFLPGLQFPKFTKLRTLKLKTVDTLNDVEKGQQLFPRGIRSRDIFPAVDDLSIISADWENAFPHEDSIPIFSSVHTFCFDDDELVEENIIAKLALMCPNLKHCTIQTDEGNPEQFNFPRVGREIWTHLNQLESLEVDLDVNLPNHAFPALDSCFTGISVENCQRLDDLMKAEKAKNRGKSLVKLPESEELRALTEREHPSILDMKNLKKLTINPHSWKTRLQGKNFFTTKITWISEEFAFKLMPQLQFNGRKCSVSS